MGLEISTPEGPNDRPTLVVTVGPPRAGKSTWAMAQGHPVVNPDSIRLAIHGQVFCATAEPYVWAVAETMVRSLFAAGHATVVLDATNVTRVRRNRWRDKNWKTLFKVCHPGRETCIARATGGGRTDLVPVIQRMCDEFEPLGADEREYPEPAPEWKRWQLAPNGFPRRRRIDLWTRAERAINEALQTVEAAGAHTLLTEAVVLLDQAQNKVADFVELDARRDAQQKTSPDS